ncbi:MAG: MotA/TolQ/ExbB proton channel family protein [Planctomycetes bacterium]|nr:MotA/TolQ/ExbB proton channel family protein [Planctomycetota bacterium]
MREYPLYCNLLILGQTTADAAVEAAKLDSVWDFVVKGGPVMVPIILCSFVALAVFIERLLSLRRRKVIPPEFVPGLKGVLRDDPYDTGRRRKAIEYCTSNGSPIAAVCAAGIKRLSQPIELLERHIQDAGEREVLKLRKYLRILSVIASVTPLLGLLGTIMGMIAAFRTVANSSESLGRTEVLAEGIYEAMITTASGLMVAIPALMLFHWISSKIDALVSEMDRISVEFVEEYALGLTVVEPPEPAPSKSKPVDQPESPPESAGAAALAPA